MPHVRKITVLGASGVGKSALTVRFCSGAFVFKYDPTVEDQFRKPSTIDEEPYILDIVDTAGTERLVVMRDVHIHNSDGFMLVYSLIAEDTFRAIPEFWKSVVQVRETNDIPAILVGNKCDLKDLRSVDYFAGQREADRLGMLFTETSAKLDIGVTDAFHALVRHINAMMPPPSPKKKKHHKRSCTIL
mmetsp:Transcript_308/g.326  ORF Transcript_308/g.326 Transcript_308/m.326 type:complete len:188 (+) Transcript_308:216-779(+)